MLKLSLAALALAAGLSATPLLAQESSNSVEAHVEGNDIDSEIRFVGCDVPLKFEAVGSHQRNRVLLGCCPVGTKPPPVVVDQSGLNIEIPYCE